MHITTVTAILALVAAILVPVGCHSSGADKAVSTSRGIESYRTGLKTGTRDIDAVVGSLDQLAVAKGDLRFQYDRFTHGLAELESQSARVRSIRRGMEGSKDSYMAAWNKNNAEIKDDDLRKASEKNRDEVLAVFAKLARDVQDGNKLFDPFMTKLKDMAKYLDVNLNAQGIAAIAPKVKEISAAAGPIKEMVDTITADLDALMAKMANNTQTPEPAK